MPLYYPPVNLSVGGNSTSSGAGYIKVSSGTVFLAGGNNVTLSQAGNAVTISGSANANGGIIASYWPDIFPLVSTYSTLYAGSISTVATQSTYTFSLYIQPFIVPYGVVYTNIGMLVSNSTQAGTGSATHIWSAGIYSNNASTLSLIKDYYGGVYLSQSSQTSCKYTVWTASTAGASTDTIGFAGISTASLQSGNGVSNGSVSGNRYVRIDNNASSITLTGGNYWFVFGNFYLTSSSNIYSNVGWAQASAGPPTQEQELGVSSATNSYFGSLISAWGAISTTYSSASNTATMFLLPTSINTANISSSISVNYRSLYFQLRGL